MTAPARMTAAPRHPFEVVTRAAHPHPMLLGLVARIAPGLAGKANAGELVVITDARRHAPTGPLWLDLTGLAVRGPMAGLSVTSHMTLDVANAGGLIDHVSGEYRVHACTTLDHPARCWHVVHTPLVGGKTRQWEAHSAPDAAQLAATLAALAPTFA